MAPFRRPRLFVVLYLVRHGQTAYNLARRYQGALDSPLTALGEQQAMAAGRRLATLVGPDTPIVSSPLGRARRTSELIRDAGGFTGAIAIEPRLAEITLGRWDGVTDDEIEAAYPGARAGAGRHGWFFVAPQGETYEAFAGRIGAWLVEAVVAPAPLIAVSHGIVSRVLRGLYAGLSADEALMQPTPQDAFFRLGGGAVERIDCDERAGA
jgi:probable phosphoglycerate mutase